MLKIILLRQWYDLGDFEIQDEFVRIMKNGKIIAREQTEIRCIKVEGVQATANRQWQYISPRGGSVARKKESILGFRRLKSKQERLRDSLHQAVGGKPVNTLTMTDVNIRGRL